MKRALFFTAYDRPEYLADVLTSWTKVRGLDRWQIVARIEPGKHTDRIVRMFADFYDQAGLVTAYTIVNDTRLGVLHHPWVGFEELFKDFDFVARTEDDLLVSDDILEFFEWASESYEHVPGVATIHGFSLRTEGCPSEAEILPQFNPLVFGTWRAVWQSVIGPTWDHDYSTFNGIPGTQAGWDWNLNTRIYPKLGLGGVYPVLSRVSNIGVHGTHSTPENYYNAQVFVPEVRPTGYHHSERS